jgi:hypothetical protein
MVHDVVISISVLEVQPALMALLVAFMLPKWIFACSGIFRPKFEVLNADHV